MDRCERLVFRIGGRAYLLAYADFFLAPLRSAMTGRRILFASAKARFAVRLGVVETWIDAGSFPAKRPSHQSRNRRRGHPEINTWEAGRRAFAWLTCSRLVPVYVAASGARSTRLVSVIVPPYVSQSTPLRHGGALPNTSRPASPEQPREIKFFDVLCKDLVLISEPAVSIQSALQLAKG